MFFDYRSKKQYVYQILSDGGSLGFADTVARFLRLGDKSAQSQKLLAKLQEEAPVVIDAKTPPRRRKPGLRAEHFANFSEGHGYYSWLFRLMFESEMPIFVKGVGSRADQRQVAVFRRIFGVGRAGTKGCDSREDCGNGQGTDLQVRISRTPLSSAISRMSAGRSANSPTVTTPGIRLILASMSIGLTICRL